MSGPQPVTLPDGFEPYRWATPSEEVAARSGVPAELVLRFDQNVPPLPGVPQVPLARSFAELNLYPDGTYRELREAAAAYVGAPSWQRIVVGAGADDLILLVARAFLGEGRRASLVAPTYSLYRIASELAGASWGAEPAGASVIWRCNPNNPTGTVLTRAELAALAREHPHALLVVDEAYVEFGAESAVPLIEDLGNVVVLRTLSKAFALASLRVGFAVASERVADVLEARRAPAPISGPAARIAAAALREPRLEVDEVVAERERVREALASAGFDAPPVAGNFVWVASDDDLGGRLEEQGILVRRFAEGIRITLRRPAENDVLLRALGVDAPVRGSSREAVVVRTTTETALRITLDLDGSGRSRVETGIGFLDHLLTLTAFHAGFDLDLLAAGDLEVDDHHTVEDVLAALGTALSQALAGREGVARYGSAVVPMDEARAIAAVDLVRRPHAEIDLAFGSGRVGGLAVSLLAHALERFAMEAGCTVHVEARGGDDHHVAEAAFKALGQALKQAVAPGGDGIRSTKGAA